MQSQARCPVINVVEMNRSASPWSDIKAAQADGGIARSEEYGGFWAILGYAEVKQAAMDVDTFTSTGGSTIPSVGVGVPALPTEVDPPQNLAFRRLLAPALRPERVATFEPSARALTDRLIDDMAGNPNPDLVRDLARRIPPQIIAEVMGLPVDDTVELVRLSHGIDQAAAAQDPALGKQAALELIAYIDSVVAAAAANPTDSLVSQIATAVIEGEPIEHDSAVGLLVTLILAGHSTTINGIGSTLWLLGTVPGLKQRLIDSPDLIPAAIEEALRLESPIPMMARTTTCPVDVGSVSIAPGSKIGLMWGLANHDESKFENADTFDLDRGRAAHLAFGYGVHKCLGEHLARMEIRVVVEQVLKRMPQYTIDGDVTRGGPGLPTHNRGLATLPIRMS